jgi:hypothetical protein
MQDAFQHSWTGLIAGTDHDGDVKWLEKRTSAVTVYVVGADPVPAEKLAV